MATWLGEPKGPTQIAHYCSQPTSPHRTYHLIYSCVNPGQDVLTLTWLSSRSGRNGLGKNSARRLQGLHHGITTYNTQPITGHNWELFKGSIDLLTLENINEKRLRILHWLVTTEPKLMPTKGSILLYVTFQKWMQQRFLFFIMLLPQKPS